MGTHPIFESDFDCLTDLCKTRTSITKMVFTKHIEIGGVVYSEKASKPAAIVNVISLNRLLVDDGSCGRFEVNVKDIKLTDLERYKLMRLKQQKARIVNAELGKLKSKK